MNDLIKKIKEIKDFLGDIDKKMNEASPEDRETVHQHLHDWWQQHKSKYKEKIDQIKSERPKKPTLN